MKWNTRTMIFMGLMVAMSIILTRILAVPIGETIRISFGDVPIILAGILFGPLAGAVTGAAADIVGVMLKSQGGFFIGFTLSSALTGFIPGLFFLRRKAEKVSLGKIILIVTLITVFISLILNTYWLTILVGKGFFVILTPRLLVRAIIAPLEVIFLAIILRAWDKYRTSR